MATTNDKQQQHLATLADAFFEQLIMLEWEYGAPGLDPKRPFGNSDVERDILVILDIDPEGDDGDAECFSSLQREYATDLFRVQLIPFLQKTWATRSDAGLAVRALEELHQLGYAVRDGLLYPPERAQPAGDAALPVVAGNDHEANVLRELQAIANDGDGEFWPTMVAIGALGIIGRQQANYAALERCATGLQADLVEDRNRIASMRTEWGAEVAALTAQARHAEDCLDAAKARIAELEPLSVTHIMLDIVPGDGDGYEVYAKSVADVEAVLSKQGSRIEELEGDRACKPAAAPAPRDTAAMLAEHMLLVESYSRELVSDYISGHGEQSATCIARINIEASARKLLLGEA